MAKRKIPTYGRKRAEVESDLKPHHFAADVPIGNTDPTVLWGRLEGGPPLPNASRRATGPLRSLRGKYSN